MIPMLVPQVLGVERSEDDGGDHDAVINKPLRLEGYYRETVLYAELPP